MSKILIAMNGWTTGQMFRLGDVFMGNDTPESLGIRESLSKRLDGAYMPSHKIDVYPFHGEATGIADIQIVVAELSEFMDSAGVDAPAVVYYANERDIDEYPLDNYGWVVVFANGGLEGAVWGDKALEDTMRSVVRDGIMRANQKLLCSSPGFIRHYDGTALFMFPGDPAVFSIKATTRGDFRCYKDIDMHAFITAGGMSTMSLRPTAFPDLKSAIDFIRKEATHA